jgi:hypothetical protein
MGNTVIIPRIFGGLSNQLFIYAAARRLALVNGADLALDHISGFAYDSEYQRHYQLDHFSIPCRKSTAAERLEPFARIRRYLKRKLNQRLPFEQRRYLVQEGIDFDARLLTFKPQGMVYLEGYWQSEDYFEDVEPQIRADLRIHPPTDTVNQQMVQRIQAKNAVAVHVRFFDAPTQAAQGAVENNAPDDYYQRAIKLMEERASDTHYYIFSDQPKAARARIPLPDDRITLVHHNHGDVMAYADLWLMSQCRHFVIANSTFSWWGAWLAEYPEKIVIAPGFEQRTGNGWGFVGLLPDRWIKI